MAGQRRIELRFGRAPEEIVGDGVSVSGLRLAGGELVEAGLVVSAVGYRSSPVDGLPFDEAEAVVPNQDGRVAGVSGAYVAGWIKRGPSGGIGANKWCARETVTALLADYDAGLLDEPTESAEFPGIDFEAWSAIDRHERTAGKAERRPRVKLVSRADQLRVAGLENQVAAAHTSA